MKRTYVPPSGVPSAKLAIVGEQPGMMEVRSIPPKPFVGPAGQALNECLQMTKILRSDVYLTNVIKDFDAPLSHYINIDKRSKWVISEEGYTYINELADELKKLKPNCVLALGNIALLALTSRVGITKWRGSVLESTIVPGLKVIPTFHPATFIPPKFNFLNKPLIIEDLLKAKRESEFSEIIRVERTIYTKPYFSECIGYLNYCYEAGSRGDLISLDIEVINREVDCFSIGHNGNIAMSIPLRNNQGDYFTIDQELEILLLLAKIVQSPNIAKVGANIIFDLQFLFNRYGMIPGGSINCTQIAQKILYPDFPAGLDFVTTMHTDIPYYKADGKQWIKMGAGSWDEWWNYSAMDSIVPVDAFPKQYRLLKSQGNLETYERQRKLIEHLIYMSERGIKVDVQGMEHYRAEQQTELDRLDKSINEIVGREINTSSPKQLKDYFYDECKIHPYKSRTTGNVSTDVDALKRIFRLGIKGPSDVARSMLDIRSLSKRISTYLNIGKIDIDGRYRSSYKPVGAETGRLSSGETIFGTGGNQQNWPHDLLRFFVFDEGYIGYSIDLSQIENRIVAYVGGVISQIEAFENDIDLHALTASIIIGKPYTEISDEDGSSDIGDGRHSERYWGKKGNHALNYDVGYKTFALVNEMPESEAKKILEDLDRGYPQIKNGYQALIRAMLMKDRTVTNLFGRKRLFLGPIHPTYNVPKGMCENTYREAYAHLPQSTCADKVNEQGLEFIYYNQHLFKPIELLAQIHDSIVFQIPLSVPWIEQARMLLMIKESLETPLIWHSNEIKTPVSISIGFNMCEDDMIKLKPKKIPTVPEALATKLEEVYERLISVRAEGN